jgi:hypothetical protein
MINPNMKFKEVHEISDIVFEDDSNNINNLALEDSFVSKMKLSRKIVTQMNNMSDDKKVNMPSMVSYLRTSEFENNSVRFSQDFKMENQTLKMSMPINRRSSVRVIRRILRRIRRRLKIFSNVLIVNSVFRKIDLVCRKDPILREIHYLIETEI